ncbi:YciI family protein [Microbacterium sp. gxy059]|uniref:YciI family protein n=1 Tax=Microbacterium sp. gxy059 TaxID=2957199 RepID=UPI003D99E779
MTATHLLLHRYRPGDGPQEGTPEHDAEMRSWAEIDERLRGEGIIAAAFALDTARALVGPVALPGDEILFAVHAIRAADDAHAERIARSMPTADYGVVEVRPIMS